MQKEKDTKKKTGTEYCICGEGGCMTATEIDSPQLTETNTYVDNIHQKEEDEKDLKLDKTEDDKHGTDNKEERKAAFQKQKNIRRQQKLW
jgi:hypothetical protein